MSAKPAAGLRKRTLHQIGTDNNEQPQSKKRKFDASVETEMPTSKLLQSVGAQFAGHNGTESSDRNDYGSDEDTKISDDDLSDSSGSPHSDHTENDKRTKSQPGAARAHTEQTYQSPPSTGMRVQPTPLQSDRNDRNDEPPYINQNVKVRNRYESTIQPRHGGGSVGTCSNFIKWTIAVAIVAVCASLFFYTLVPRVPRCTITTMDSCEPGGTCNNTTGLCDCHVAGYYPQCSSPESCTKCVSVPAVSECNVTWILRQLDEVRRYALYTWLPASDLPHGPLPYTWTQYQVSYYAVDPVDGVHSIESNTTKGLLLQIENRFAPNVTFAYGGYVQTMIEQCQAINGELVCVNYTSRKTMCDVDWPEYLPEETTVYSINTRCSGGWIGLMSYSMDHILFGTGYGPKDSRFMFEKYVTGRVGTFFKIKYEYRGSHQGEYICIAPPEKDVVDGVTYVTPPRLVLCAGGGYGRWLAIWRLHPLMPAKREDGQVYEARAIKLENIYTFEAVSLHQDEKEAENITTIGWASAFQLDLVGIGWASAFQLDFVGMYGTIGKGSTKCSYELEPIVPAQISPQTVQWPDENQVHSVFVRCSGEPFGFMSYTNIDSNIGYKYSADVSEFSLKQHHLDGFQDTFFTIKNEYVGYWITKVENISVSDGMYMRVDAEQEPALWRLHAADLDAMNIDAETGYIFEAVTIDNGTEGKQLKIETVGWASYFARAMGYDAVVAPKLQDACVYTFVPLQKDDAEIAKPQ